MFNVEKIRTDFPILKRQVYGKPLVYLDNAATTQKPQAVIDTITNFYHNLNSNIHRGVHRLSSESTEEYEKAREKVRAFINAKSKSEIIFTAGTTASINLVATSFGEAFVGVDDEIIISEMEHHSNLVPWQMLCQRKGAQLKVLNFDDAGTLNLKQLQSLITHKTRLVAVTHASNTLGTVNPIGQIIATAHAHNVPVLIDGAQGVKHQTIDIQQLDADFYAFSGHKLYGPTGIGVLYGKEKWLEQMPPYQGGGDMVGTVTLSHTTFNDLPFKFEAGTSNYIGAAGLATAIDYYQNLGIEQVTSYENELLHYATTQLLEIDGLTIFGRAPEKAAIVSFVLNGVHPYDTGMILDKMGVAVRTGNHCTQPVIDHFALDGTVRASFAFYNTKNEIDQLVAAVKKVKKMME